MIAILFAISFSFTSCTKEGPIGPAGTTGTDGVDGENGTDGIDGENGEDGAANVENIDITVTPSQWTYDDLYEVWYYRYNTDKNSNSLVYGYVMSGSGKQAMPYHAKTSYSDEEYTFATNLFDSPSYIELQYVNLESSTTKPTSDVNFYLIIVPPTGSKANVDYSDYNAVMKYYNLN